MNLFDYELSLFCLVPALILCGYVLYRDKLEKEPISLLLMLFGVGIVCGLGGQGLQNFIVNGFGALFRGQMEYLENGVLVYASHFTAVLHQSLCAFVGVALVQVVLKWAAMFLLTHRNKAFNYLYDGVVYATVLSLGYALAECVAYAYRNGFDFLAPKLLTAVPAHLFVGILMGWFYTMWRARFLANRIEKDMLKAGIVKIDAIRSSCIWLIMSIVVPLLVDGLYVLSSYTQEKGLSAIFVMVVFVLYGFSYVAIDRLASKDNSCKRFLVRLIAKGHPDLRIDQIEAVMENGIEEAGND